MAHSPQPSHGWTSRAIADLDADSVGADGDDLADILVSHGQRQFDAAIAELQPLAAAQIVIAVPDVQIAVADAGGDYLEQDLGPGRLRSGPLHQPQRRAAFANDHSFHRTYSSQQLFIVLEKVSVAYEVLVILNTRHDHRMRRGRILPAWRAPGGADDSGWRLGYDVR